MFLGFCLSLGLDHEKFLICFRRFNMKFLSPKHFKSSYRRNEIFIDFILGMKMKLAEKNFIKQREKASSLFTPLIFAFGFAKSSTHNQLSIDFVESTRY